MQSWKVTTHFQCFHFSCIQLGHLSFVDIKKEIKYMCTQMKNAKTQTLGYDAIKGTCSVISD